jgi:hypothetical protein
MNWLRISPVEGSGMWHVDSINREFVGFEVITAVVMKCSSFWDGTLCS